VFKSIKPNKTLKYFTEHIETAENALQELNKTYQAYLENEHKKANEFSYKAHMIEKEADLIRRRIIEHLQMSSYLQNIRKDIIKYLGKQDNIVDRTESACDFLITQKPIVPECYNANILAVAKLTKEALVPLKEAVIGLFTDYSKIKTSIRKVNDYEEEIDGYEWHLTKNIFNNKKLETAQKIHLKELVFHLTSISDVIENAADLLDSIAVKKII